MHKKNFRNEREAPERGAVWLEGRHRKHPQHWILAHNFDDRYCPYFHIPAFLLLFSWYYVLFRNKTNGEHTYKRANVSSPSCHLILNMYEHFMHYSRLEQGAMSTRRACFACNKISFVLSSSPCCLSWKVWWHAKLLGGAGQTFIIGAEQPGGTRQHCPVGILLR